MNNVFSVPIASLAKLVEVRCPRLCAEILFVLLLKFGVVLSIICGFFFFFFADPFTAVYRCLAVISEVDKTSEISGLLT